MFSEKEAVAFNIFAVHAQFKLNARNKISLENLMIAGSQRRGAQKVVSSAATLRGVGDGLLPPKY